MTFLILLYLPVVSLRTNLLGNWVTHSWPFCLVWRIFFHFLWLMCQTAYVRRVALVAGLIGGALFALPQAGLMFPFIGGMTSPDSPWSCPGSVYIHPFSVYIHPFYVVLLLLPAMLILWFVSTLLGAVIFFKTTRMK